MNTAPMEKTYDGRRVLALPALEFLPSRLYAVIGPNGSGKSTMAKILAGTVTNDRHGRALPNTVSVGYMPQRSYAFRMSTRANICLGSRDEKRAEALMRALGISPLAKQRATRLSGGEMARMALARLLMMDHDLLVLDEPTASMDMEATMLAEALMVSYCRERGCPVLLVTHSLQQARRVAKEALFLQGGQLVESGPASRVLCDPTHPDTRRFLEFFGS